MNEEARAKVQARKRAPAMAALFGALLVGALALAIYFLWANRAETPMTPAEAVITDDLDLPAPDAARIRAEVDRALADAPPAAAPAPAAVAPPESGARAAGHPPPPLPPAAPAPSN